MPGAPSRSPVIGALALTNKCLRSCHLRLSEPAAFGDSRASERRRPQAVASLGVAMTTTKSSSAFWTPIPSKAHTGRTLTPRPEQDVEPAELASLRHSHLDVGPSDQVREDARVRRVDRRTVAQSQGEIIACLNAADVNVILGVEAGSFCTAPPSRITTTRPDDLDGLRAKDRTAEQHAHQAAERHLPRVQQRAPGSR